MSTTKSLPWKEVQSCLKNQAWKRFPISQLQQKVEEAKVSLKRQGNDSTLVEHSKTTQHIVSFLKNFCIEAQRDKILVQDLNISLEMEQVIPTLENIKTWVCKNPPRNKFEIEKIFNILYQKGLPLELGKFVRLIESLTKETQDYRSFPKRTEKEFWWNNK